jgi:predicted ABC-type ATPase
MSHPHLLPQDIIKLRFQVCINQVEKILKLTVLVMS